MHASGLSIRVVEVRGRLEVPEGEMGGVRVGGVTAGQGRGDHGGLRVLAGRPQEVEVVAIGPGGSWGLS